VSRLHSPHGLYDSNMNPSSPVQETAKMESVFVQNVQWICHPFGHTLPLLSLEQLLSLYLLTATSTVHSMVTPTPTALKLCIGVISPHISH
jgi:hypothetical protein